MNSLNNRREEDEYRVQCLLDSNLLLTPICFFVKRDCPPAARESVGSERYSRRGLVLFRVKTTHISPSTSSLCGNSLKKGLKKQQDFTNASRLFLLCPPTSLFSHAPLFWCGCQLQRPHLPLVLVNQCFDWAFSYLLSHSLHESVFLRELRRGPPSFLLIQSNAGSCTFLKWFFNLFLVRAAHSCFAHWLHLLNDGSGFYLHQRSCLDLQNKDPSRSNTGANPKVSIPEFEQTTLRLHSKKTKKT